MSEIDLSKLALPFPAEDIEWRVSRAGIGPRGIYCMVLAYITARAIQNRLDEVCTPPNWRNEEPRILEVNGKSAFAVGISIRFNGEWITKWDVAEPTPDRGGISAPARGGFSQASKRAGAQWGIGRYLYYLDEIFAEVAEKPLEGAEGWAYAKLPEKHGGGIYYWKRPNLPAWALPKEPEHEISLEELNNLKRAWQAKFAPDCKNPAELREGFSRLVRSLVGEFPSADYTCWTREALEQCQQAVAETTDPNGVDPDVPFEE
jgi:hypothetical protein